LTSEQTANGRSGVVDSRLHSVRLCDTSEKDKLIDAGLRIIAAINEQRPPAHPLNATIRGIHHVQFAQPGTNGADTRNAVLNVPGYFDRSPCGTGTSAILALRHHRQEIGLGVEHVNESMLGTRFTGARSCCAGGRAIPECSQSGGKINDAEHSLEDTEAKRPGRPVVVMGAPGRIRTCATASGGRCSIP
jgi:proline racemase